MIRVLMLGGTGAIGQSILSLIGNNHNYDITITSRSMRVSDWENVQYICGNANDLSFINTFDDNSYDVLIDFMNYRDEILEENIGKLIRIARQYIFLSSARVYDDSQRIIDENCTLLLDTSIDKVFRNSGTYAVKKAYQERLVRRWGGNKVTIIRPYKTFSSERLQLGEYEIKHWLQRLVNGKPIILNKNILKKYTALTDGTDVAEGMVSLFANEMAMGETFNIVTDETMTWNQVLSIYMDELEKKEISYTIYLADNTEKIDALFEDGYQMPYDIKYDRRFLSSKMDTIHYIEYKSMEYGLRNAIKSYLVEHKYEPIVPSLYDEIVDKMIENNNFILWRKNN